MKRVLRRPFNRSALRAVPNVTTLENTEQEARLVKAQDALEAIVKRILRERTEHGKSTKSS